MHTIGLPVDNSVEIYRKQLLGFNLEYNVSARCAKSGVPSFQALSRCCSHILLVPFATGERWYIECWEIGAELAWIQTWQEETRGNVRFRGVSTEISPWALQLEEMENKEWQTGTFK